MSSAGHNGASSASFQRILVVRLGSMGDIIHTLPAVAALRQANPSAVIGWAVEERWAELLCALRAARSGPRSPQRPLVERVHSLNTRAWRTSLSSLHTWEQIAAALSDIRAGAYQAAVDFQGAARSALIARWSGAPVVFGQSAPRENLASMFYTRTIQVAGEHVVQQAISLAAAVAGQPLKGAAIEFPEDKSAEAECERQLRERGIETFVLLNPGAGWGAKQWPADRYGEVARRLAGEGIRSVVNFGPGERLLAAAVENCSKGAAEGFGLSLPELIAFTKRARLFIGGDTGPLHLAAALGVPVVAIFGPTNPSRNGPFCDRSIVLRSAASVTSHRRHPESEAGLLEITPEQVLAAARSLLRSQNV